MSSDITKPYFQAFEARKAPNFPPMSQRRTLLWQFSAGMAITFGFWYLHWRWTQSLNPEALYFSVAVVGAETLAFLSTCLFFFDIWSEGDTRRRSPPEKRSDVGLPGEGAVSVDVMITTYDEGCAVVRPSVEDALRLEIPDGVQVKIHVLDDGRQPGIQDLCENLGVEYHVRDTNIGFKAGNIREAVLRTEGDFLVICDADTRVFPSFLTHTLGYFRDPKVAWVQTPHWFYDIPSGRMLESVLGQKNRVIAAAAPTLFWLVTGRKKIGVDPYMADSALFFDVIQRRRNRHGASFCCGAGSIHRREAVLEDALHRRSEQALGWQSGGHAQVLSALPLQPYCFHVSEDILTSIHLHSRGWTSVYHPQAEARMLSPWSMEAWATQQLKYAGGTFDIMLRHNPLLNADMPWRMKLHYGATFASYLAVLWMPILMLAPIVALFLGTAPVAAYSLTFFAHLLPFLLANEWASFVGCKGHDTYSGRLRNLTTIPIVSRAAWAVLQGRRPRFPPTPKTPGRARDWSRARVAFGFLTLSVAAGVWGAVSYVRGTPGYSLSLVIANAFWLAWNGYAFFATIRMCAWLPPIDDQNTSNKALDGEPNVAI